MDLQSLFLKHSMFRREGGWQRLFTGARLPSNFHHELSRKVVRKVIRSQATEFRYERGLRTQIS
jgi:hypothetical protein